MGGWTGVHIGVGMRVRIGFGNMREFERLINSLWRNDRMPGIDQMDYIRAETFQCVLCFLYTYKYVWSTRSIRVSLEMSGMVIRRPLRIFNKLETFEILTFY